MVKLTSEKGSCSAEQVRAPSGVDYILTAAHCRILEQDGMIHATTEDGRQLDRRIIAEDPKSDLMLLEGIPGMQGLDIASKNRAGQHVKTFTHGAGLATYKTEGEIIQDQKLKIIIDVIANAEDEKKCDSQPKYKKIDLDLGWFKAKVCILDVEETITTAMVVPGSSGGMVVDDSGDLTGVVSAGGNGFGALVRLQDIKAFLSNY